MNEKHAMMHKHNKKMSGFASNKNSRYSEDDPNAIYGTYVDGDSDDGGYNASNPDLSWMNNGYGNEDAYASSRSGNAGQKPNAGKKKK